jgi:hypothetical protein
MQSNTARAAIGAALIAAAVVLFVVLNGGGNGDDSTTSAATQGKGGKAAPVPTIVVKNGKPVGGIRELDYNKGDEIRFRVKSDVGDEVHVHGYDLMKDVKPGGTVSFDFPASLEGIFEAELEARKEQIIELRVNP